ncbi:MAG: type II toxin-antitoxin system VapC family toxin [Deltaproteobacteria bacterium]|nr:type II toxin-antitoxin system VapC family toxin [Deltaproteobacteria bacterium]
MRAIDTNVLVRLLTRDEARQAASADEFASPGAWISHIVLVEALWVLDSVYERTPDQLAASVGMLLEHASLVVQDADIVSAALEHFRERPALGFSDCLVLEVARKAGHLPLGTFDRNLSKLPDTRRLGRS